MVFRKLIFLLQILRKLNHEYAAVCSLLHRSGLQNINNLTTALSARQFHTSPSSANNPQPKQSSEGAGSGNNKNKPNKEDEDDNKVSSLLAKAFLWMLTAYMVIAIISLLFPNSNQPEVDIKYTSISLKIS